MDLPLKHGALVSSVATCPEGLDRLSVETGRKVCVMGEGSLGKLSAPILQSLGLQITVVDQEDRWLSDLHRYDINTLNTTESLESFDYVVETSGDPDLPARIIRGTKPTAKILFLASDHFSPSNDKRIFWGDIANVDKHWLKAIHLIRKGKINLEDHTATVEPLEQFQKTWDRLGGNRNFIILVNPNKELEDL